MNPQPKRIPYLNEKITRAAEGEICTVQRDRSCHGENTESTVAAHLNTSWSGKGMGQKADDCAIVFACARCHIAIDSGLATDAEMLRAYYRTIRRLLDKGVLK